MVGVNARAYRRGSRNAGSEYEGNEPATTTNAGFIGYGRKGRVGKPKQASSATTFVPECTSINPGKKTMNKIMNLGRGKWRRGRDSNPRYHLWYTPLAGERLRPLGHLSGPALIGVFRTSIKTLVVFPLKKADAISGAGKEGGQRAQTFRRTAPPATWTARLPARIAAARAAGRSAPESQPSTKPALKASPAPVVSTTGTVSAG